MSLGEKPDCLTKKEWIKLRLLWGNVLIPYGFFWLAILHFGKALCDMCCGFNVELPFITQCCLATKDMVLEYYGFSSGFLTAVPVTASFLLYKICRYIDVCDTSRKQKRKFFRYTAYVLMSLSLLLYGAVLLASFALIKPLYMVSYCFDMPFSEFFILLVTGSLP